MDLATLKNLETDCKILGNFDKCYMYLNSKYDLGLINDETSVTNLLDQIFESGCQDLFHDYCLKYLGSRFYSNETALLFYCNNAYPEECSEIFELYLRSSEEHHLVQYKSNLRFIPRFLAFLQKCDSEEAILTGNKFIKIVRASFTEGLTRGNIGGDTFNTWLKASNFCAFYDEAINHLITTCEALSSSSNNTLDGFFCLDVGNNLIF